MTLGYHRLTASYPRTGLRQPYPAPQKAQVIPAVYSGDRYWVAAAPGNWETPGNWSTTSGGTPNTTAPGPDTNVIFDAGSTQNCTVNRPVIIKTFHLVNTNYTGVINMQGYDADVYGKMYLYGASSGPDPVSNYGKWTMWRSGLLGWYQLDDSPTELRIKSGVYVNEFEAVSYWVHAEKIVAEAGSTLRRLVLAPAYPTADDFFDIASATISSSVEARFYLGSSSRSNMGFTISSSFRLNYGTGGTLTMTGDLSCTSCLVHGSSGSVDEGTAKTLDMNGHNLTCTSTCTISLGGYTNQYVGKIIFGSGTHSIGSHLICGSSNYGYIDFGSCTMSVTGDLDLRNITVVGTNTSQITLIGSLDQDVYCGWSSLNDLVIAKSAGTALWGDSFYGNNLTVAASYTGAWDCNTFDTILQGNLTLESGSAGTWNQSTGVIALVGSWDSYGSTTVVTYGTSHVQLQGVGQTIRCSTPNNDFGELQIDGSYTLLATSSALFVEDQFDINTGASLELQVSLYAYRSSMIGGTLTGSTSDGRFYWQPITSGNTLWIRSAAAMQNYSVYIRPLSGAGGIHDIEVEAGATIALQTAWYFWTGAEAYDRLIRLKGTPVFACIVSMYMQSTANFTIDNSVYNPSITLQHNFSKTYSSTGVFYWTKGTNTLTISGAVSNITFDGDGRSFEDLVINKSAGRLTFTAAATFDTITFNDGDVDINGQTITSAGLLDVNGGAGLARFWDGTSADMSNGAIIVGGALTMDGTSGNQLVILNLDFQANGASAATTYCTVTNSQNTGAININATGIGNVDGGTNTGWLFAAFKAGWALEINDYIGLGLGV